MTPEEIFCQQLQGFIEISGGSPPTQEQWTSIVGKLKEALLPRKKENPIFRQQNIPNIDNLQKSYIKKMEGINKISPHYLELKDTFTSLIFPTEKPNTSTLRGK